jgi:hypothetical protein
LRLTARVFEFHIIATPPRFIINQACNIKSMEPLFDMARFPRITSESDYAILGVMDAPYEYPNLKAAFLAHHSKTPKYAAFKSAVEKYCKNWGQFNSEKGALQINARPRLQENEISTPNAVDSQPPPHESRAVVASVTNSSNCERQSQAISTVFNSRVQYNISAEAQVPDKQFSPSSVPSLRETPSLSAVSDKASPTLLYRPSQYAVDPVFRDLLLRCPYPLKRIALENGPLESATAVELFGIFRLGKKGHLPGFKKLLSSRSVTKLDKVEKEEDLLQHIKWMTCKMYKRLRRNPASAPRTKTSTIPTPSCGPMKIQCRTTKYEYFILTIAGRDLPITIIVCYQPDSTNKRMCFFGGFDEFGERAFLPDWTYRSICN